MVYKSSSIIWTDKITLACGIHVTAIMYLQMIYSILKPIPSYKMFKLRLKEDRRFFSAFHLPGNDLK